MTNYLSVTENGIELIHNSKPTRKVDWGNGVGKCWFNHTGHTIRLHNGTIRQLIGRDITFQDGPICLKTNKIY